MRLPLKEATQFHAVRGGTYYRNDANILYWLPARGNKQLLSIYCPNSDWAKILREK